MEKLASSDPMVEKSELAQVIHHGRLPKQAAAFLKEIHEKHGDDKQFQHFMKDNEYRPASIENPLQRSKLAGYLAWMYNWIRDHEVQQLREDFQKAQDVVVVARSTGRRRDIAHALQSAENLRGILLERYDGRLWEEETVAGRIDPRFKRSDENMVALTELKSAIQKFIDIVEAEFKTASKQ
jgi:hypothetical protein